MSLQGILSYIYWGRSSAYKAGDPSSDEHQAFNALLEFSNPLVHYTQEHITTSNKLEPNIVFDKSLEIGNTTVKAHFRDPFPLLSLFTYKTMPTNWTGAADVITGTFANLNNKDKNIWVQVHVHDQSGNANHVNLLFDGGEIVAYKFILEQGQAVMEEYELQFAEVSANIQPVNIDTGFDDGSFDLAQVKEVSTILAVLAANIGDGDYFLLQGISGTYVRTTYYVWFDKQGAEQADPAPTGYTKLTVDISGDVTAQNVSDAITAAIHAVGNFTAANGAGASETVTVTNANFGDVMNIVDVDSGLTLATTIQGAIGQNGGWGNWDGAYDASLGQVPLVKDCTIEWNGDTLSGLHVQKAAIEVGFPKNPFYTTDSLTAAGSIVGKLAPHRAVVEGLLAGNQDFSEYLSTYANKTKGTFKIQYGTTKYVQFTNAYIFQIDPPGGLPPAGEAQAASYIIVAGANSALSFSWTANEATDPEEQLNHTNV